jgi:hypothetical protein
MGSEVKRDQLALHREQPQPSGFSGVGGAKGAERVCKEVRKRRRAVAGFLPEESGER